jgi:hypothetical protein
VQKLEAFHGFLKARFIPVILAGCIWRLSLSLILNGRLLVHICEWGRKAGKREDIQELMAQRKQHEIAGGRANERLAWTMGKGSDWQKWTGLYFYSEMDTKA